MQESIDIAVRPSAVFSAYPEAKVDADNPPTEEFKRSHIVELIAAIRDRAPIRTALIDFLAVYPEMATRLPIAAFETPLLRSLILNDPAVCFYMLGVNYKDRAPILEEALLAHGAEWVRIVMSTRFDADPLMPDSYYRDLLLKEVWWARDYAIRTEDHALAEQVIQIAEKKYTKDPQATLVHLLLNEDLDPRPHAAILSLTPVTALFASRFLAHRGVKIDLRHCEMINPRWACNLLLHGGNMEGTDRLENDLFGHGGWLGEYVANTRKFQEKWAPTFEIFNRFKAATKEPRDLWFKLFLRMGMRLHFKLSKKAPAGGMAQQMG